MKLTDKQKEKLSAIIKKLKAAINLNEVEKIAEYYDELGKELYNINPQVKKILVQAVIERIQQKAGSVGDLIEQKTSESLKRVREKKKKQKQGQTSFDKSFNKGMNPLNQD